MTDYTERNEIVEAHYRANVRRLFMRLKFKKGGTQDAYDIVHSAYELALRYYPTMRDEFNPWFNMILENAERKFDNDKRAAGLTSGMWDMWGEVPPDPLAIEAKEMIKLRPDNERTILTLHFLMGYNEQVEVPDMVPETVWQVRMIVAKFKRDMAKLAATTEE
jgi:DNA-directed RNA polymerase specialized sigma24 family protein